MRYFALLCLLCCHFFTFAGRISGRVLDEHGNPLAFASVFLKGTTLGTTTGNDGHFFLEVNDGQYTIIAQFVGYARAEKQVNVVGNVTVDFQLMLQQTTMKEIIVTQNAEDPAYAIIRHAIAKRKDYLHPLDSFTCEAYIKTLIKTRKLPTRLMGEKIDAKDKQQMGVDSAGKGILFLSESLTRIAYKKPDQVKLEVLSGRESGTNGFGFNFPTFIDFYNNNVNIFTTRLSPRGFVSPIAESALNYYRYKFLGSFFEDGKEINKIQVTPKRPFEPLFTGTINITENDWRIHSLDLLVTKQSQLEVLDTIFIRQLQVPVTDSVWRTKDQVVTFTFNKFGVDAVGNFLNVYNRYNLQPQFPKKFFNNVVVKYDTSVNKKAKTYWDSIRPVQLEPEEIGDYQLKDSLFRQREDSAYTPHTIDSLKKAQGPLKISQVLWAGGTRSNFKQRNQIVYRIDPLLRNTFYNSVEGLNIDLTGTLQKIVRERKARLQVTPHIRYGFSNGHLNPSLSLEYNQRSFTWSENGGNAARSSFALSGGKRVNQFNKNNPITQFTNSTSTLLYGDNYMKIYENSFVEFNYGRRWDNGLDLNVNLLYEDRHPLENTTFFTIFKSNKKEFTPNYPFEKLSQQFSPHQASIAAVTLQYKPGQRYIEYPRGKVPIGSKYPTFSLQYQKGIDKILGSDVDFDKWYFTMWDELNFKLQGRFMYRFGAGGFLNARKVQIQDYQHFNGNQGLFATVYLNSFQLAPYYQESTTASFFLEGHIEHHFNGMLTNKVPGLRKLNWYLVAGSNAFYVSSKSNYVELFAGLENILKFVRVDFIVSYLQGTNPNTGIRVGFDGLLSRSLFRRR
jgi:Family of unknown function (DUF5686)/CarboxypepD_reg-like domain